MGKIPSTTLPNVGESTKNRAGNRTSANLARPLRGWGHEQGAMPAAKRKDKNGQRNHQSLPPPRYLLRHLRGRGPGLRLQPAVAARSEEHTSELQSLMRISYAVFCLKKNNLKNSTY